MYESHYIKRIKSKSPEPDPQFVHELNVLRAMVRQEDRQGDVGWGGTWTKERYQSLKDKHPERGSYGFRSGAKVGEGAATAGDPGKIQTLPLPRRGRGMATVRD